MGGCLVLDFLVRLWSRRSTGVALLTMISVFAAWWIKERYWRFIDTTPGRSTAAAATTLGSRGQVRLLEAPHTQENYLLQEMGFRRRASMRGGCGASPGSPALSLRRC